MRTYFVFSLVFGFATSLAAQSIDPPASIGDLSGSIAIPNLPLPDAQFTSRTNQVLGNDQIWALRFPDEVDHKGSKFEKNKTIASFSEGKFLPASLFDTKPATSSVPIVEQSQSVGQPWWVDWPSTNLHNQLRPDLQSLPFKRMERMQLRR